MEVFALSSETWIEGGFLIDMKELIHCLRAVFLLYIAM